MNKITSFLEERDVPILTSLELFIVAPLNSLHSIIDFQAAKFLAK